MPSTDIMMSSTQNLVNLTGPLVKADGWYGFEEGLHTVSIQVVNFTGRIFIEASLELQPQDSDWFPISLDGVNPYLMFPLNPAQPTGSQPTGGDTITLGYSFKINSLWLRARMDRTYLNNPLLDQDLTLLASYGNVVKITLAR